MNKPFARAAALFAMIAAAAGDVNKLANLPAYVSRGHGIARHSGKKWGSRPSGKYSHVFNGEREVARRVRQLNAKVA